MSAEPRGTRHLLGVDDNGTPGATCGVKRTTYKLEKSVRRVTCVPCLRVARDYAEEHSYRVDLERAKQVRERLEELEHAER